MMRHWRIRGGPPGGGRPPPEGGTRGSTALTIRMIYYFGGFDVVFWRIRLFYFFTIHFLMSHLKESRSRTLSGEFSQATKSNWDQQVVHFPFPFVGCEDGVGTCEKTAQTAHHFAIGPSQ